MITIIGAGAAGNYSAYLLARQGFDVQVIEANETIGIPIACTGILTSHFDTLVEPRKEFIANEIDTARIHSPNNQHVTVRFKHPNKIMRRDILDQNDAKMAKQAGAEYRLGEIYLENRENDGKHTVRIKKLKTEEEYETQTEILIGADGPASRVAKNNGLFGNRKFYYGLQATATMDNNNAIDFYPSQEGIAWVVPESKNRVRIGIAGMTEPHKYFDKFCTKILGENYKEKLLAKQAGPIPLYEPGVKTQKGNVYTVGDAATMVKATTLGGIMQSHIAGKALAKSLIERKNYEKEWRKELGRDLWMHLMMRKAMDRFEEKDYNRLIAIFQKEKNRKILEEYDRDFPTKYMTKLLMQEPGLLYFAKFLLQ
ncbi:NAD(P)/FAD-dependent oxidoreductase [Candidatus Woesearchaeota archaeon]|nr:NAD(P)/FAD-dependent oxidoreductase [Candidatus Woesearchaeota archaeon]